MLESHYMLSKTKLSISFLVLSLSCFGIWDLSEKSEVRVCDWQDYTPLFIKFFTNIHCKLLIQLKITTNIPVVENNYKYS